MRYVILACVLGLVIACDLALFIASSDDALGTFDPLHPATLLPIMADRLHALRVQVGEWVNVLVEDLAALYREHIGHEGPTPAPEP